MSRLPLWARVLIGLLAGALAGPLLGDQVHWLQPLADLFMAALRMLVVPLVLVSLISGVAALGSVQRLGRLGGRTLALYALTTAAAVPIGIALGLLGEPGAGLALAMPEQQLAATEPPPWWLLVPDNPVRAMAEGHILQLIVFALLLGYGVLAAGESARPFRVWVEAVAAVVYKVTDLVIACAPVGVFALIALVTARTGLATLLPLLKLVALLYLGCLLHAVLVLGLLLRIYGGLNPLRFFQGIFQAQMLGFSTTSAAGTLPVTLRCAEHNLGVPQEIARFVLPVGATLNMDGTALYQGLAALFIAQVYGVELGFADLLLLYLTTVLASVGTASVPAAGLVAMGIVLAALGLPLEGIALIAGVDRLLDMARTTVNITGDAAVAVLVARAEGRLDLERYERAPE